MKSDGDLELKGTFSVADLCAKFDRKNCEEILDNECLLSSVNDEPRNFLVTTDKVCNEIDLNCAVLRFNSRIYESKFFSS